MIIDLAPFLVQPPELAPHALHRIEDALDDLRMAIATSQSVAEVYPIFDELRLIAQECHQLALIAGSRGVLLLEE